MSASTGVAASDAAFLSAANFAALSADALVSDLVAVSESEDVSVTFRLLLELFSGNHESKNREMFEKKDKGSGESSTSVDFLSD